VAGHDRFHDAFFPGEELTYYARDLSGLHVIGLDTYDKPGRGGDAGGLSRDQLARFRSDLAAHRDQPTLVFGHHPLVVQDSAFPVTASNSLDATQASSILDWYAQAPGVFLHHAGHTHSHGQRLHTKGYALNFYKSRSELARAWSERSRREILGYWPQFAFKRSPTLFGGRCGRGRRGVRRA
jgi:hypothetical protein